MITVGEFSRLVSAVHAAAVEPEHWVSAMADVSRVCGATGGGIILSDGVTRSVKSASIPPDALQPYMSHYHRVDYVLEAVERSPVGLVHSGKALIELDPRSEFNADWMRPHHMDDGLFVRLTDGPSPTCFLVATLGRNEPFATTERVELVNALVPHLQQALRTQMHLQELRREADDTAGAVDSMPAAVVVVGPRAAVVHANSAAEVMLSRTGGLGVTGGRLRADSVAADADLQRSVAEALGLTDAGARRGSSLLCPRRGVERPLVLHVFPFTSRVRDDCAPRALVVVVDPERRPEPTVEIWRRLFGLTHAESDVAVRVARGQGLAPIADELSLSLATVKTHVQRVFEKTGTHRQAELVRLLLALAPLPPAGGGSDWRVPPGA
ncbi:helix-turn-helix transcriptional regulator [Mycolicibacterium sp. S2-37]|uniref:helix-turn-helix transcriptional regulator n=1 Tax=Mycolicibacterium sp. S2-37 TaxID=2810297 RepID=UPI001A93F556|nr:helix-turn-helix transcriptional regulator [Mycolicibacterium sp. S2-37]MBO0681490.1 helix-turn-helix transcriptional regulator [Mycolicibacterium sp. S2-37]